MTSADPPARRHRWSIAEREYVRHETRRGRRFAFTELVPARTALVVVDMVPFFVRNNPYCRDIVPRVDALAGGLRAAGGVVAWVVPATGEAPPATAEFLGTEVARRYRTAGGTGPPRERLWPELTVFPEDLVVEKTAPSAFFPGRCDLPELLRRASVDTVVITGTVTDVCCESSARDASTLGFRVILVADANATGGDAEHNATLRTIYRSFGDVRTTAEILTMLKKD